MIIEIWGSVSSSDAFCAQQNEPNEMHHATALCQFFCRAIVFVVMLNIDFHYRPLVYNVVS